MLKSVIAAILVSLAAPAYADTVSDIQQTVNTTIKYHVSEDTDFWVVPTKRGDCKGFALAKRQLLINAGWDPADLQILLLVGTESADRVTQVGHVVLYVKSQNAILDMPSQSHPSKVILPAQINDYLINEHYRYFCKVADITNKRYTNVSDRCDRTSFHQFASK